MDDKPDAEKPASVGQVSKAPVVRLEELGELIRQKRKDEGLTLEEAAQKTGISAATLSRLERQKELQANEGSRERIARAPDMRTLAAVTRWLGVSLNRVGDFEPPPSGHELGHHIGETTPDIVEAHLRADKNLDPATAGALARMFRAAYEQFAGFRPVPTTGTDSERTSEGGQNDQEKTD